MAGHSKWSQIKHQKATADIKRGQLFSKILKAIAVAARSQANPDFNPQLRDLINQAKDARVPKEKIERAVARGHQDSGN